MVDDKKRAATYAKLQERVGVTAEAIAAASEVVLADAIDKGGMQPRQRAGKLKRAAAIALELGAEALARIAENGQPADRRELKRFPGIGDPGADKLLLFTGVRPTLAPESNGLRVLVRLGVTDEARDYGTTYRQALQALSDSAPLAIADALAGHHLLRRHGQQICRRSRPLCGPCPSLPGVHLGRVA